MWTGSEMIVWGGHGDSGYLNTGGRYNPGTDSGQPPTSSVRPLADKITRRCGPAVQ